MLFLRLVLPLPYFIARMKPKKTGVLYGADKLF
jgi:hypothetical protein